MCTFRSCSVDRAVRPSWIHRLPRSYAWWVHVIACSSNTSVIVGSTMLMCSCIYLSEDEYSRKTSVDDILAELDILDTGGLSSFATRTIRRQYLRGAEGFLIVYSVTDKRSFAELDQWLTLIERARGFDQMPSVLVGSKADLSQSREVSRDEGEQLAAKLGCPFFEVSAMNRSGVDDAFDDLVRVIRRKEKADQFKLIGDCQEDRHQSDVVKQRSKRSVKKRRGLSNAVCKAWRKLCSHWDWQRHIQISGGQTSLTLRWSSYCSSVRMTVCSCWERGMFICVAATRCSVHMAQYSNLNNYHDLAVWLH